MFLKAYHTPSYVNSSGLKCTAQSRIPLYYCVWHHKPLRTKLKILLITIQEELCGDVHKPYCSYCVLS